MLLMQLKLLTDIEGDPSKSKENNPVTVAGSFPPQDDAAAQNERRELIRENRELHRRLERADKATQGLQRGYEEMDEREREATQDLKLKETELANCRETLRIQSEDLDARSSELLTFKKRSTKTYRNLKEQRDSALRERSNALDEKEN